ncbi:unnamed protein product [Linum tenue]|uniref:Aminotransferase-like plant mobile domain-containing protein n=1 Tax=Linum tenue TaxID=586396 RepID=A0AAV0I3J2_9ROSI|nr:unnamed protein product [Linum tenue]
MLVDEAMARVSASRDESAEAWCYLLCLIGSTLFVDKSSDRVRGWLYSYFRNLAMVGKYAWGAGALAWMYRQLGRSSRAGSGGFSGCLTLLQAWIYEYFPSLRINRRAPEPMTEGGSFARRWEGPIRGGDLQRRSDHYRRLLDGFTAAHVDWLPFGANPGRAEPRSLWRGFTAKVGSLSSAVGWIYSEGRIIIVGCWMDLQRPTWIGFLLVLTLVVQSLDLCIGV